MIESERGQARRSAEQTANPAQQSWRHIARLAAVSAGRFIRLAAARSLHRVPDRLGVRYAVDQGGSYEIFRETVSTGAPVTEPIVLVVGFQLRFIDSHQLLHWCFQRICLLTTPFWSGFPGFRVKLWMVESNDDRYLGIYEWDGARNAQTYVDALVRVLGPLSTTGSVWFHLYPTQALEPFLSPRRR